MPHHHPTVEVCEICLGWPDHTRVLAAHITRLEHLMTQFSSDQAHLDADVTALTDGLTAVEAEIAALKSQPQASALDFTALDAAVARVTADVPAATPTPVAEPGSAASVPIADPAPTTPVTVTVDTPAPADPTSGQPAGDPEVTVGATTLAAADNSSNEAVANSGGLPLYEYAGVGAPDLGAWPIADVKTPDNKPLYHFAGDSVGNPSTAPASDDWQLYTGPTVPASS